MAANSKWHGRDGDSGDTGEDRSDDDGSNDGDGVNDIGVDGQLSRPTSAPLGMHKGTAERLRPEQRVDALRTENQRLKTELETLRRRVVDVDSTMLRPDYKPPRRDPLEAAAAEAVATAVCAPSAAADAAKAHTGPLTAETLVRMTKAAAAEALVLADEREEAERREDRRPAWARGTQYPSRRYGAKHARGGSYAAYQKAHPPYPYVTSAASHAALAAYHLASLSPAHGGHPSLGVSDDVALESQRQPSLPAARADAAYNAALAQAAAAERRAAEAYAMAESRMKVAGTSCGVGVPRGAPGHGGAPRRSGGRGAGRGASHFTVVPLYPLLAAAHVQHGGPQ